MLYEVITTNYKQIPQALVKDEFRRHPGIRAPENDREGRLACNQIGSFKLLYQGVNTAHTGHKAPVAFPQSFQCLSCSYHGA